MIKKILFVLFLCISTIGFSQEKSIEKLSVTPNPFINSTKISFTSKTVSKVTFSVKNVLGKTVFKKTFKTKKGKNSIPFSKGNLLSGMYIYTLQDSKNLVSKRFVIQ
ncbi:MAG: T9SS type A sorting domain-containing protein [Polaribacter sp.]